MSDDHLATTFSKNRREKCKVLQNKVSRLRPLLTVKFKIT